MSLNCILITIDCLRADRCGYTNYHRETPFIDSMANQSMVFSKAFATGPSTPTSFPGILASMYGLDSLSEYGLPETAETLASSFLQYGYKTAAFHSNPYLDKTYGYGRGFTTFKDYESQRGKSKFTSNIREKIRLKLGADSRLNQLIQGFRNSKFGTQLAMNLSLKAYPYCTAEQIFSNATAWLNKNTSPFFMWLHLMDIHMPYVFRDDYIRLYRKTVPKEKRMLEAGIETTSTNADTVSPENMILLSDLYDSSLRYVDDQIKQFVNILEKKDLLNSTVVALTSDHGEAFGEHGFFGHLNRLNYQTHFLYDEVIHVPLFFYAPSHIHSQQHHDIFSMIELEKTLLELTGCRFSPEKAHNSLAASQNKQHEKIIFSEGSTISYRNQRKDLVTARTKHWKYIKNQATGKNELYDLRKDPYEKKNIADQQKDKSTYFKSIIDKHLSDISNGLDGKDISPQEQSDDEKIIERLKDLGYM